MTDTELTDEQARELVQRWVSWTVYAWPQPPKDIDREALDRWLELRGIAERPLDESELAAILGWVSREMVRERERRTLSRLSWPAAELHMPSPPLDDNNRSALAGHIATRLGLSLELAGTLCQAAAEQAATEAGR